ncbi:MAG: SEL1-like repeat protein, partial [Oscillospiraceae bacterium]
EEGIGTPVNMEKAKHWYKKAAEQNHDLAIQKCQDLNLGDEYRARLTLPRTSTLVRGFMLPYKKPGGGKLRCRALEGKFRCF